MHTVGRGMELLKVCGRTLFFMDDALTGTPKRPAEGPQRRTKNSIGIHIDSR